MMKFGKRFLMLMALTLLCATLLGMLTVPGQIANAATVIVDDRDTAVNYNTPWNQVNKSGYYNGTASHSTTTGNYAQLSFTGSSVKVVSKKGSNCGIADIYLDGVLVASFDCYSPSEIFQVTVYENNSLEYGPHTIRIQVSGNKNPASSSRTIYIDCFQYNSTGPTPTPTPTPSGWTVINPSADSRVIYVSSSSGSDSNDGLSPSSPVKTLAHAATLVRDGYPDHMLLKRGDVWKDETLGRFKSGRSLSEPILISYYGTSGNRPLIKASENFIDHGGQTKNYLALIGLEIVGYQMDPEDPEFIDGNNLVKLRFVGGGDGLLIEDCKLRYCELIIQGATNPSPQRYYSNVKIRRNIIVDTYYRGSTTGDGSRPSGLFASYTDGLLIEENVFDHNGWNGNFEDSLPNMYNHNIYIQYTNIGNKVVVRGNIITRGSSHGVHGRPGGLYEDNFFAENAVSLQMGYNGHPLQEGTFATARNNVILDGRCMIEGDTSNPQSGAVWGLHLDDIGEGTFTVQNNVAAHRKTWGGNVYGIRNLEGVSYSGNLVYDWLKGATNNKGLPEAPFDPEWLDPDRSIGSYNASLGGTATTEAFLDVVRNRPLHTWNTNYTAYAINNYIRAGFNK